MSVTTSYKEQVLQAPPKPHILIENLTRAGVLGNYFLYERPGETSIVGDTLARISVSKDSIRFEMEDGTLYAEPARDPFKQVQQLLGLLPVPNWTAYGYVGFDIAKFYYPYAWAIERPLLQFIIPRIEIRIAGATMRIRGIDDLELIADLIDCPDHDTGYTPKPPALDFADRQDYSDKVKLLTEAIRDGALQKAILARRVCVPRHLDLLGTYALATQANNAARSYCFKFDDISAVGVSPEILLESDAQGLVTTNPLAGTRPRGSSASEDEQLEQELFSDAKEVKEHAISVLQAQEEISSICSPDTARIYDFMLVKKFRRVQHLSSRVAGKLRPGRTVWDALKALFPGVTVSGIDKVQALRWISDLEAEPRGIYGGAVGWIDSQGQADLALAIRSVFQYGDTIHLNAGAGIVAESVPEREYIESVNKMSTMLSQIVVMNGRKP